MKAEKLGFHGVYLCVCVFVRARTCTCVHTHSEDSGQCWVSFSLTVQLVDSNQHCILFLNVGTGI